MAKPGQFPDVGNGVETTYWSSSRASYAPARCDHFRIVRREKPQDSHRRRSPRWMRTAAA